MPYHSHILVLALQRSPAPEMRWPPRAGCVHGTTGRCAALFPSTTLFRSIHFDRPPAEAPRTSPDSFSRVGPPFCVVPSAEPTCDGSGRSFTLFYRVEDNAVPQSYTRVGAPAKPSARNAMAAPCGMRTRYNRPLRRPLSLHDALPIYSFRPSPGRSPPHLT